MADWLRPVFARAKTPVQGTTPAFDRLTALSHEDHVHEYDEPSTPKLRASSRVSSYIGLRPNTPPVLTADAFQCLRISESQYHRPSGDQMAETLKVIMMNQGAIDPLPVEYNACILHVLEAYHDLREQVNAQQDAIEELKQSHTKDIKEFEALATRWEITERDYKAEVKKLEVLLSKTEGGMESVVMARSNSRVHGSQRASDEIGRSISTIKERHSARSSRTESDPYAVAHSKDNDNTVHISLPNKNHHFLSYSQSQFELLDRRKSARQPGMPFDSSSSEFESSTDSFDNAVTGLNNQDEGLGIAICEKPLPDIPRHSDKSKVLRTSKNTEKKELLLARPNDQLSFSFRPGDDITALSKQGEGVDLAKRQILDDHIRQRNSVTHDQASDTAFKARAKLSPSKPESRSNLRNCSPIIRGDSTGSVVTAIRDNSGRSSIVGSRPESKNDRPELERQSNSNEAIMAAVRALAGSRRPDSRAGRMVSSSPEDTGNRSDSRLSQLPSGQKGKGKPIITVSETSSTIE